jgi:hypothetical protein
MDRNLVLPALFLAVAAGAAAGCGRPAPTPSHVDSAYRGKLRDDTMMEASTTVLATTKEAVIALDCTALKDAIDRGDRSAVDRAVAGGMAARLPAGVTIYSPPFSPANPQTQPFVVTDDKRGGTLCTPGAVEVLHS